MQAFKGPSLWIQDLIRDVFEIDVLLNQSYTKLKEQKRNNTLKEKQVDKLQE